MNPQSCQVKYGKYVAYAIFCFLFVASAFANNPIPTVVGPPVPQAVVPGSGEFTLTVYGANFVSGAVVNWNRSPRSTTFISARELQAQILASDVTKQTAGYITVTNPPPGGGVSSSSYAIVEVHTPTKTIAVNQPGVYLVDGNPSYVVTGDFYDDGILDLVTGAGSGQVALNRGEGNGTFQSATTVGTSFYAGAGIGVGDFSGDGRLDLVYGYQEGKSGFCDYAGSPPCYLKVLMGDGRGDFHGLHPFGRYGNQYPAGIVVGDFNGDGILDLAVFEVSSGGGVFLGNGDGTFKHVWNFYLGYSGGHAVAADFNGDGKLDLVVEYEKSLYLLLGNGDGTFQKARRIVTDKYSVDACNAVTVGLLVNDFNGDGNADLAFCDFSLTNPARIGVLLGNGDGTFQKVVYYATGFRDGLSFAAGDFRSDGKTDLIVSTPGQSGAEFEVFWGNGDGTFQKAKRISLPDNFGGQIGLVPGDFNSDGLLDFVMVNASGLWVYVQK